MTWRRRFCLDCGRIFTTKESATADNLFVLKRNGSRQRFTYEKLFVSVFTAINAKKNSDKGDDAKLAKKISEKITHKLFAVSSDKLIESKKIIDLVYKELKRIDNSYAGRYMTYSDYRLKALFSRHKLGGRIYTDWPDS